MENTKINEAEKLKVDYTVFMDYINQIRDFGGLDLFAQLFQSDCRILFYLRKFDLVHPSKIADDLSITRPNVAANLRMLEAKRYIIRSIDKENHRQVYVAITPLRRRLLDKIDEKCIALFKAWFELLGEEEVKHLFNILKISADAKKVPDGMEEIDLEV